jgi:N-acetylglucosaminyldiphosphoundecaprenol N-acetyl-beta-D-mannosaminyltransferase
LKASTLVKRNPLTVEHVVFCGHTFRGLSKQRLLEATDAFTFVVTVNADFLVTAEESPRFTRLIDEGHATFDGQITLWLARCLARPRGVVFEKVSGSSFANDLLVSAATKGERVFMLGAQSEVNAAAVRQARTRFGAQVDGYSPPVFAYPGDATLNEDILRRIAAFRPHVLLVAFGSPKQEFWIDDHRVALERSGVRLAMGCGGTLDFLAGSLRRAPLLLQRFGLEGVYRLLQEPSWMRLKRLARSFRGVIIAFKKSKPTAWGH